MEGGRLIHHMWNGVNPNKFPIMISITLVRICPHLFAHNPMHMILSPMTITSMSLIGAMEGAIQALLVV